MPTLHINADDFGLHPDIDRGVLACIERRRVTGISVSAIGPHIDWSVVRSLARGPTSVGVHVTLVGERWLTRPLTFASWSSLVPWLLVPGRRAMLETEIRAQIDAFVTADVRPTHLDSHQHVHVLPTIWTTCVALAREYDIARVRVPSAPTAFVAKRSIAGHVLQRLSLAGDARHRRWRGRHASASRTRDTIPRRSTHANLKPRAVMSSSSRIRGSTRTRCRRGMPRGTSIGTRSAKRC